MSHRGDGTVAKRQRIQKIQRMILGAGDVDLTRFLATCEYQMGLTRLKARAYLQTLVDLGLVEVDEATGVVREVKPDE